MPQKEQHAVQRCIPLQHVYKCPCIYIHKHSATLLRGDRYFLNIMNKHTWHWPILIRQFMLDFGFTRHEAFIWPWETLMFDTEDLCNDQARNGSTQRKYRSRIKWSRNIRWDHYQFGFTINLIGQWPFCLVYTCWQIHTKITFNCLHWEMLYVLGGCQDMRFGILLLGVPTVPWLTLTMSRSVGICCLLDYKQYASQRWDDYGHFVCL